MQHLMLALRPKQWVKNLFIFLPLIFGKKLFIFPTNIELIIAFVLFSITASVVYIMNDILDIDKDRLHPIKALRPIASGNVGLGRAKVVAAVLGTISISCSLIMNTYFGLISIIYILLNIFYSKIFKEIVIIDVFCIGLFFLLRIIAGSVMAGVEMSHWIIMMTVLLALFLGFTKRRQELELIKSGTHLHRVVLTKYSTYFIDQMIVIITSSIVVVYMLYTIDARTIAEFGSTHLLYTIPFVYYGIFRYLYLIHKLSRDGDPTVILFTDNKMQINLVLWFIACVLVIYAKV